MNIDRVLAAARVDEMPGVFDCPDSDTVAQNWIDRLAEGVIDDLILRTSRFRIGASVLRCYCAIARMRTSSRPARSATHESPDGSSDRVYNREAILAMLFRETDRVQRMNSALSLVLLDIDDFGHWNSRLATSLDDLLCQVAPINRLCAATQLGARMDEFLLVLRLQAENARCLRSE